MSKVLENIFLYSIKTPDKLAVVFEKEEVTYKELWESSLKVASYLKEHGIKKGDRVVVKSAFSKWFVSLCYGTWLCNAVFVPSDEKSTEAMLEDVKDNLKAKFVFSDFSVFENCSLCNNYEIPSSEDYANIMFTTGTTGNPKGVIWTHKNIDANCIARYEMFGFCSSSVDLSFVPLNHAAPLWKLYALNNFGGTCILLNGMFNLGTIYKFIDKYGVNSMYTSPSGVSIIQSLAPEIFTDHAKQLQCLSISSSGLNTNQKSFVLKSLPFSRILFAYGASESGGDAYIFLNENNKDISCVGRLCKNVDIKIVNSDMEELPQGQIGNLIIKSDMVFAGYWNNEELSKKSFYKSYYVSSDVGYFDNQGYLYICGRNDDVINIGGLKVYPQEIENAVLKLESVEECICFPVDDEITKQAACLLVKTCNSSIQQIRNKLSEMLDSYKIPKYIEFVEEIEKTANGKPNRKKMSEKWLNKKDNK